MFSKCMAGSGSERKGGVVMQGEIEEKWRSLRASPPGEVVVVLDAPEGFGSVVGVKGACVVEVREVLILFISFVFFLLKAKNAGVLLQHPLRGRRRRRRYTLPLTSFSLSQESASCAEPAQCVTWCVVRQLLGGCATKTNTITQTQNVFSWTDLTAREVVSLARELAGAHGNKDTDCQLLACLGLCADATQHWRQV